MSVRELVGEQGAFWDKSLLVKPDTRDLFTVLTNVTSMFSVLLTSAENISITCNVYFRNQYDDRNVKNVFEYS